MPSESALARPAEALRGLFVLNSLRVGGSESKVVRVANALRREGVVTGLVSLNDVGELATAVDPGVPVWCLHRRGKFSLSAVRGLQELLRAHRPDVVLAINLYPALYVSLATSALTARPRTVGMMNTSVFARRDAWRPWFYRPFLRRFDAIVYGCELQRTQWRAHLGSLHARSTVIYNGIDVEHFAPIEDAAQAMTARQSFGISPHAFVVGSVGRLTPAKNQTVLIEAIAELRRRSIDAHLLLVGDGSMREELQKRAQTLSVQAHVSFAGVQRDVRPALAAMDVFVLPSTHVETFSNAALEAMAMCKPVVLSRLGGAEEMVREGVEGFVLDVVTLAQALPSLLARLQTDRQWRDRLGQAARRRVIDQFSLQSMVQRYAALLSPAVESALPLRRQS